MQNGVSLDHIDTWIFDLDNTLYPPSVNLFAEIDARMSRYIAGLFALGLPDAKALQKKYFLEHGTTLRGLMDEHGADPDAFLEYVHDIDMSALAPDTVLAAALQCLPGRKILFTNADSRYAWRVLDRLGVDSHFDAVHCIRATGLEPKPRQKAYDSLIEAQTIAPARSIFFEDMAVNLKPAKAMGMTTVWVDSQSPWSGLPPSDLTYIDFKIENLSASLAAYTQKDRP